MSIYLVVYFTFDLLICSKPKPYPDMADAVKPHVFFTLSKTEAHEQLMAGSQVWRIGVLPTGAVAKLEKRTEEKAVEVPVTIYTFKESRP